jgi:asparaginyl-tRNA synthetase
MSGGWQKPSSTVESLLTITPKRSKPFFYMRDDDEDGGETVNAMDLLVPGVGEFAGGSQREERLDVLLKKMDDQENLRIKT